MVYHPKQEDINEINKLIEYHGKRPYLIGRLLRDKGIPISNYMCKKIINRNNEISNPEENKEEKQNNEIMISNNDKEENKEEIEELKRKLEELKNLISK